MAKIGIFGGAFNPVHKGHVLLLSQVFKKISLDRVIVIPSNLPPHKRAVSLASFEDRFNMCKLSFKENINVEVSDIEGKIGGISHTINTLKEISQNYKNDELYLIIGSDMALSFHKWFKYDEILSFCTIVAAAREDKDHRLLYDYSKKYQGKMIVVDIEEIEISSTALRLRLAQGLNCDKFLSEAVSLYIKKHNLYKECALIYNECENAAEKNLTNKRFEHSKNVAKAACKLASHYGLSQDDAQVAGILHDIMKNKTQGELLSFFEKHGIILSALEQKSPSLWHAYAGAVYAKDVLFIDNLKIINAIKYHTTAKADMSLFEKIIYVADYISEERAFKGVKKARKLAFIDIDLAILHSLKNVIFKLSQNLSPIHPDSFNAYNELLVRKNKKIEEECFFD